jgi:copper transport protein
MRTRSGSARPRLRPLVAGVALLAALLLGLGSPASAHSELERSEPGDGGTVEVERDSLTLWFTEPVDEASARFELNSDNGTPVAARATITNDAEGALVELKVTPLWQDTYILEWDLLSTIDGHDFPGSIVFGAGVRPATTSAGGIALPDTNSLALRWLDLFLVMVVIGGVVVSRRTLGPQARLLPAEIRRANRLTDAAAVLALITGALIVVDRVPRYGRTPSVWIDSMLFSTMAGTTWGRLWAAREIALAILIVAQLANRRIRATGRRIPPEVVAALAVIIGAEAWAGHAGTLSRSTVVAIAMSAAHLASASVWAGGLVVLAVVFAPWWDRRAGRRREAWSPTAVWNRFSSLAAASLVVLIATGLYASGRHLPDLGDLTSSVWGVALTVKLALAAAALALAGLNAARVRPDLAAGILRRLGIGPGRLVPDAARPRPPALRSVRAEAALLVLAIGTAAGLVSVATPHEVSLAESISSAPVTITVGDLFTTIEVVPAGEGRDRIIVRANSTRKPAPAPIDRVTIHSVAPDGSTDTLEPDEVEVGRYSIDVDDLAPGIWDLEVTIEREGLADAVARYDWDVEAIELDRAQPLEKVATAGGLALLASLAALLLLRRRRDRAVPPSTPRTGDRIDEPGSEAIGASAAERILEVQR